MMHSAKKWSRRVAQAAELNKRLHEALQVSPAALALDQAPHFYFFIRGDALVIEPLAALLRKMGVARADVRPDVGNQWRIECV